MRVATILEAHPFCRLFQYISALRFNTARSPASRLGVNVFTTPPAPSTRGKD